MSAAAEFGGFFGLGAPRAIGIVRVGVTVTRWADVGSDGGQTGFRRVSDTRLTPV
jgi:hypothetical protein